MGNRTFTNNGAYTGVCSMQHVPSYKNNIDKLKAKGIDSVICVAVNDPYVMNGWAEKLQAKEAVTYSAMPYHPIEFYGDFDGSFHKSLDLTIDLSAALLGPRSHRWSAYVVDGNVKLLLISRFLAEMLFWDRSRFASNHFFCPLSNKFCILSHCNFG
ncbi:hypothetical protein RND71_001739 [Anisodus tanguticus]|uniref:Glutaredoxin-dependent peroxiredoxin n=1 Tax=Anisodus tanguticus TaxID=243964 RepID=A0AAE1T2Y6_9SOLA|nr:hypothetical protein RND71_001739 [Anisodus tanguticus]